MLSFIFVSQGVNMLQQDLLLVWCKDMKKEQLKYHLITPFF